MASARSPPTIQTPEHADPGQTDVLQTRPAAGELQPHVLGDIGSNSFPLRQEPRLRRPAVLRKPELSLPFHGHLPEDPQRRKFKLLRMLF